MITLSEKAVEKVAEYLKTENKEGYGLRVYVSGGGAMDFNMGCPSKKLPERWTRSSRSPV